MHCPIEDCNYVATHAEAAVVVNIHATTHAAVPREPCANAKMEKLRRPSIALAGTANAETWSYFLTRWGEYKRCSKLVGCDVVTQVLRGGSEKRPHPRSGQELSGQQ